jgi:hypothetical protein
MSCASNVHDAWCTVTHSCIWCCRCWFYGRVPCTCTCTGHRERYGGTEFALTDLVDKAKIDVVISRYGTSRHGVRGGRKLEVTTRHLP